MESSIINPCRPCDVAVPLSLAVGGQSALGEFHHGGGTGSFCRLLFSKQISGERHASYRVSAYRCIPQSSGSSSRDIFLSGLALGLRDFLSHRLAGQSHAFREREKFYRRSRCLFTSSLDFNRFGRVAWGRLRHLRRKAAHARLAWTVAMLLASHPLHSQFLREHGYFWRAVFWSLRISCQKKFRSCRQKWRAQGSLGRGVL